MRPLLLVALLVPPPPRTDADGVPLPPEVVSRVGSARLRTGDSLTGLRFSPDGHTLLATTGWQAAVVAWDAATGRPRWRVGGAAIAPDNYAAPRSVGVVGNEAAVVAAGPDGTPVLVRFDLATGRQTARIPLAEPRGYGVAHFSPDGKRFAVHGYRRLAVYDARTGTPVFARTTGVSPSSFSGNGWSADGRRLVEADRAGLVTVYDAATGAEVRQVRPAGRGGVVARLSPDGSAVAAYTRTGRGPAAVTLIDVGTGETRAALPADKESFSPRDMTFSPDGRRLAVVGSSRAASAVVVWDVVSGKEVARFPTARSPRTAAYSADGAVLAVGYGNAVELYDAATGRRLPASCDDPADAGDLRFRPTGELVVSRAGVGVYDPLTGRRTRRLTDPAGGGTWAVLSDEGSKAVWLRGGSQAEVRDVATDRAVQTVTGPAAEGTVLGVTPQGGLLTAAEADGRWAAAVWTGAGPPRGPRPGTLPRPPSAAAVSADGRWVVCVCGPDEDGRGDARYTADGLVWDLAGDREAARFAFPSEYPPAQLAISPDGRLAAVADHNLNDDDATGFGPAGAVHLYEVATGRKVGTLRGHVGPVWGLGFAAGGRVLATGGEDRTVRVWELSTRKERHAFRPAGVAGRVAVSADGRLVASASPDAPVYVWDVYGTLTGTVAKPADVSAAWADLAADPAIAFRAVRGLAAAGDDGVRLIRGKLRPAAPLDPARVAGWLADLDAPAFAAREAAERALKGVAAEIEPALRAADAAATSAEVRARLRAVRPYADTPGGELLRGLRAVEALEVIGTPSAKAALSELAGGAPGRRLTAEAASALSRMR